jgi:phosphoglucosamine mutase
LPSNVLENAEFVTKFQKAKISLKGKGRILVRPSGTESVIRVMVEGKEKSLVESLAFELAGTLKRLNLSY